MWEPTRPVEPITVAVGMVVVEKLLVEKKGGGGWSCGELGGSKSMM